MDDQPRITLDELDELQGKLAQLNALLMHSRGNSADAFADMAEVLRENYLWCCSEMAARCHELAGKIPGTAACDVTNGKGAQA